MPNTAPDYAQVADELTARVLADADAWAVAQLTDPSEPLALPANPRAARALARLRFTARVVRELGFQVDRLARQASQAGAADAAVADARADRSPAGMRTEVPTEEWRPSDM
jgi:hypothetical protein